MSIRRGVLTAQLSLAVTLLGVAVSAGPILAQDAWIDAEVVGVAGTDFYISAGTEAGVVSGGVYELRLAAEGASRGRVTILQASASRSAVTFADAPFAITRGARIGLRLVDSGVEPDAPVHRVLPADRAPVGIRPVRAPGPEVHGSFGASFEARETTTDWEAVGLEAVDRTFTTPSAWLNLTVSQLPGGFRFRVNARGSHRGSSDDRIQPASLARVYTAQLTGKIGILDIGLGRGYNPFDPSSGYFDGIYLHTGRKLGLGVSAGYEPDRANGGLSTDVPKVTVFSDFSHRSAAVRYSAVVSATSVRPSDSSGRIDRTYVAVRQSVRFNRVRLGQSLQVDRDAMTSSWSVSRLLLDANADLGGGLSLRGSYSRRKPVTDVVGFEFQPYTRDLGRFGLGYSSPGWFASADIGVHDSGLSEGSGFNASGSVGIRSSTGPGFSLSAGYWDSDRLSTLTLRPSVNHSIGRVTARAWYSYYKVDEPEAETASHTVGLSLAAPLSPRVRGELAGRLQQGSILSGSGVSATIRWSF